MRWQVTYPLSPTGQCIVGVLGEGGGGGGHDLNDENGNTNMLTEVSHRLNYWPSL